MRVALVTNVVAPYRVPVYAALAATPGWELRLFVSAETEFDRSWRVDPGALPLERVPGLSIRRRGGAVGALQDATLHLPLALPAALRRFRPDVVVSAELGPRTALAALHAALSRLPLVVWSYPSRAEAVGAGALARARRRWLLGRARAVVGMGRQARESLRGLGVPDGRIFDAPNACDLEGLAKARARVDVPALRAALALGLGCRPRIALAAGRLVPSKGVAALLDAWSALPAGLRDGWTLLFVGDGPESARVARAAAAAARGEIARLPARDLPALAGLYAAAELLVFPSLGEPWGLVVNEAMACGLPVLCSSRAGCADDLLEPGVNGWLVDPRDGAALTEGLARALTHPDRGALGRAARARAAAFSPARMADGMRRAVRFAIGDPSGDRTPYST